MMFLMVVALSYKVNILVQHYDLVMFGEILRPDRPNQWNPVGNYWYPIDMLTSQHILNNYRPPCNKPFNGLPYPQPCVNIRTSELIDIQ